MSKSKLSLICLAILLALPSIALAQKASKSAPPVVSSIAPTSATAGGPGFALTVSGSNFSTGSVVLWSGMSISTTRVSATQLQGTIPGGLIAAAGTAQVAVYTPGRSGGTSNLVAFTINAASTTTTTTTETPLAITTVSLPVGTAGTVYSQALAASGGTAPYTWSTTSGAVPPGLTLSSAGAVSGTPTTAGAYAFTAQVADSASHTATLTYPVVISTAPLAIATASVPAGTAGSPYGTTLAASGGTPPHNWSATSALPPGLAISAAGAISGTPAAAGSYGFTAQVADSASHTAAYTYTLTVGAATPPAPAGPVFQTGFEDGSLPSGWDAVTSNVSINSNPSFVHSGFYSAQIHYTICGDSTNTACGAAHQDANRYFSKNFDSTNGFPNGLDHFFLRGYVYLKSPEPAGTKLPIQRKLVYFMENNGAANWSIVLDTFSAASYGDRMSVTITTIYAGSSQAIYWDKAFINYDQWYCLELEIKANTPGLSDGVLTLWVNGTQVWQTTTANLRGSYTTGIGHIKTGDQADRGNYLPVDEYRYWDDIVISTSHIGP
jgi:hypothetical protein